MNLFFFALIAVATASTSSYFGSSSYLPPSMLAMLMSITPESADTSFLEQAIDASGYTSEIVLAGASSSSATDAAAAEACTQAQEALTASDNALEKIGLQLSCDEACKDIAGETCGFLVNGVSMILFTILALFKY